MSLRVTFTALLLLCSAAAQLSPPSAWGQVATDDRYTFRATDQLGNFGFPIEVGVYYDGQTGSNGAAPDPVQGWAYGLCHDSNALELDQVVDGATTAALMPDFNSVQEQAGSGYTVGVVVDFFGVQALAPGLDQHLNQVTYQVLITSPPMTEVMFCDTLGSPAVETVVVVNGNSLLPDVVNGLLEIGPQPPQFIRGECNNDGSFNLPDVVFLLGYLFPPTGTPPVLSCSAACDTNNDSNLSLPDAIVMLNGLFGLPPTPLPEPTVCGPDPIDPDNVDCDQFDACP